MHFLFTAAANKFELLESGDKSYPRIYKTLKILYEVSIVIN